MRQRQTILGLLCWICFFSSENLLALESRWTTESGILVNCSVDALNSLLYVKDRDRKLGGSISARLKCEGMKNLVEVSFHQLTSDTASLGVVTAQLNEAKTKSEFLTIEYDAKDSAQNHYRATSISKLQFSPAK